MLPAKSKTGLPCLKPVKLALRCARTPESKRLRSHNGNIPIPEQQASLILSNVAGERRVGEFRLPKIHAFEAVVFEFEQIASGMREFLAGKDSWAALRFQNHSSFPPMLIRWRNLETGELQVSHSNFDYSEYETDLLAQSVTAYLQVPAIEPRVEHCQIVIYPRCTPGRYEFAGGDRVLETSGGGHFVAETEDQRAVSVTRLDGPTRAICNSDFRRY
jgi:hypothetical protein